MSSNKKKRKRQSKGNSNGGEFAPENRGVIAPTFKQLPSLESVVEVMAKAEQDTPLNKAYLAYQEATKIPIGLALNAYTKDGLNWLSPVAKSLLLAVEREPILKVEVLAKGLEQASSKEAAKGFVLLNELDVETECVSSGDSYMESSRYSTLIKRSNYDPIMISAANTNDPRKAITYLARFPHLLEKLYSEEEVNNIKTFVDCWYREPF